jgi:hypothetical protein
MKKKYEKPEMVVQEMDMDLLRACANFGSGYTTRDTVKHTSCSCCLHKSSGGTGFQNMSSPT